MPDHQPRTLAALRASQPAPELIGRHVAGLRDNRGDIDARVVSACVLGLAVGPGRPLWAGVIADQLSRSFRFGIEHVPIGGRDENRPQAIGGSGRAEE